MITIHDFKSAPDHLYAVYDETDGQQRIEHVAALVRGKDEGLDVLVAYVIGDTDELLPASTYKGFSHLAWLTKKQEPDN